MSTRKTKQSREKRMAKKSGDQYEENVVISRKLWKANQVNTMKNMKILGNIVKKSSKQLNRGEDTEESGNHLEENEEILL